MPLHKMRRASGGAFRSPKYVASIQTYMTQTINNTVSLAALGLVEDDLILVGMFNDYQFARTPSIVSTGYTLLASRQVSVDYGIRVYYSVVGATPPTDIELEDNGSFYDCAVNIASYRNVDPSDPFDATSSVDLGGTTNSPDPPSITTTVDKALVIAIAGQEDGLSSTGTPPSGYTTNGHSHRVGGGGQATIAFASLLKETAGAENPGAFSFSATGATIVMTTSLNPIP